MAKLNFQKTDAHDIQLALGESLHAQITEQGTLAEFITKSGVAKTILYRMFAGDTISDDNLIKVLKTLGRHDILQLMVAAPPQNPLKFVASSRVNKKRPTALAAPKAKFPTGIVRK